MLSNANHDLIHSNDLLIRSNFFLKGELQRQQQYQYYQEFNPNNPF